jgi:hypothetical protein
LWSKIDEVIPDDSDFIVEGSPFTDQATCGLSSVSDPGVSTGHVMRLRYSTTVLTMSCQLMQGVNVIANLGQADNSGSPFTQERTLTAAEADAITDYTTLSIRFSAAGGCTFYWFEFEVPSAAPTITQQPVDAGRQAGSTGSFSVAATASGGGGALSYQWQRAEPDSETFNNVGGATSSTYTTGTLTIDGDNGARYRCVVTDSNGSTTSAIAALTVGTAGAAMLIHVGGSPATLEMTFGASAGAQTSRINVGGSPASLEMQFTTKPAETAWSWLWGMAHFPTPAGGGPQTYTESLTETLSLSDIVAAAVSALNALVETIAPADSVAATLLASNALTETLSLADDVLFPQVTANNTLTETVAPTDSLTSTATANNTLTETIAPADTLNPNAVYDKSLTENISLADDVLFPSVTVTLDLTENISPADALSSILSAENSLVEVLALQDDLSSVLEAQVSLAEVLSLTDALADALQGQPQTYTESLTENLNLVDQLLETVIKAGGGPEVVGGPLDSPLLSHMDMLDDEDVRKRKLLAQAIREDEELLRILAEWLTKRKSQ